MVEISYRRHRYPPAVIQHAVWLYLRFTLSYRDVEDLLAERGLDISYETVRSWVLKFGPVIARRLRRRRPRPSDRWHLDEMVVRIAGTRMYLWRAFDHEGEVLDMLVQRRRDSRAALRLMRKLLRKHDATMNDWVRLERPRIVVLENANGAQTGNIRSIDFANVDEPLAAVIVIGVQPIDCIGVRSSQFGLRRALCLRKCHYGRKGTEQSR
jgi:DDE domain